MTRKELYTKVEALKKETQESLQMVINELNHGQQKKLLKNENIKALLDRYNVEYSE